MKVFFSDDFFDINFNMVKREFYFVADQMSRIIYIENGIETLLEQKAEELIGKNLSDIIGEQKVLIQFKEAADRENTISIPVLTKSKIITHINILYRSHYVEGIHKGYYGSIINVTKEKDLEHRHQLLTRILDNSKDVIYYFRVEPKGFEYISKSIEKVLGYTPEDYYNDPELVFSTAHPDYLKELIDKAEGNADYSKPIITRWRDKNGLYHCVEDYSIPEYNMFGELIGVFGVCRDVTNKLK
ncbi:PAS domain S-box protein [Clostridium sp. YIM B02505]|uniref:PAS domain S-box protein n=1 Tax=Clostridium yunnanense TaxID=2800325 RepID=A0ABS1EJ32_9CLOT|nr:PAS domain S-box protein [Clostridium yunnanense]MBK1809369.1 PAS domain S-box protein [Clostridium yunnanense]